MFLVSLGTKTTTTPAKAQTIVQHALKASTAPSTPLPTPSPTLEPIVVRLDDVSELRTQKEAIREYIYTIFGRNGNTAFAIALAEDGFPYKGERFFKTSAIHASNVEQSIGLFQINLKSKDALVHYNQVPGRNADEKIEWLSNPYNNTLFAYWMYSTHQNFEPWSVYTDRSYLKYVEK